LVELKPHAQERELIEQIADVDPNRSTAYVVGFRSAISPSPDGVITDDVTQAVETKQRLTSGPVTLYLERARGLVAIG